MRLISHIAKGKRTIYGMHNKRKLYHPVSLSLSLPPFPVDASSPPNCQLFPPDLVKVSRRAKYSLTALAGTISTQGAVIKYLEYLGVSWCPVGQQQAVRFLEAALEVTRQFHGPPLKKKRIRNDGCGIS